MANPTNGHMLTDPYDISNNASTFTGAQEKTSNMVSINNLFLSQCSLSQGETRPSTNRIGQAINQSVELPPMFVSTNLKPDICAPKMDSRTNDHVLIDPYPISNTNPTFTRAQEQASTLVSLSDLFLEQPSSSQVKDEPSTGGIGQVADQSVDPLPMFDPNVDPKKMKRMIANRESAKKCRIKQIHHIIDMEKQVKDLETANFITRYCIVNCQVQQSWLKEEHKILVDKKITMDIENSARKFESEELHLEKEKLEQILMDKFYGGTSTEDTSSDTDQV